MNIGTLLDSFLPSATADCERHMNEVVGLSIVVPVFNSAPTLDDLTTRIAAVAKTLDERYEDLARRYGPSPFFEKNLAICRRLKAEFEARTKTDLYAMLGIAG